MRPLEIVLLLAVLAGTGWALRTRQATSTALLIALGVLAGSAAAQAAVEGARWQLVPIYLAAALVVLSVGGAVLSDRPQPLARRTVTVVAVVLALVGTAAGAALPVDLLPEPPGDAPTGTTTVLLTDADRNERYGPAPGSARQIVVQAWYPADPDASVEPDAWLSNVNAFGAQAADEVGLPRFALGHLDLVETSSTPEARAAASSSGFPIVVLSHGWSGFRTIHTDLAESLASRGYVVLAIDHTYGALATLRPDGDVIPLDPRALPDAEVVPPDVYAEAAETLVATFAGDIRRTLDALTEGEIPVLAGVSDPTEVAFIGHSTGGGGAVLACSQDDRCDAVVGFDPWVVPVPDAVVRDGLDVPLLSLRSEEWSRLPNDARLADLHAATSAPEGRVVIDGTLHRDFTLIPSLSPLSGVLGLRGETSTDRTREIMDTWTARFLDHHLRDGGTDPLTDPPDLREATLTP